MAVQIRILGDVALTGPDAAPVAVTSRRGWGLVAYLVLSGGRPVRREHDTRSPNVEYDTRPGGGVWVDVDGCVQTERD